jgi:hypothetical protein
MLTTCITNLAKNSVMIERCGGAIAAPMKRTMFGCLSLFISVTFSSTKNIKDQKNVTAEKYC